MADKPEALIRNFTRLRIRKMQENMVNKGIDIIILNRPENIFYFSNFNPIITSHAQYFVFTRERVFLLVHALRYNHAIAESAINDIFCYGQWGNIKTEEIDAFDAIRKLLAIDTSCVIGLETEYASIDFLKRIHDVLNVKSLINISSDVAQQRLIKDSYETTLCRISGHLADIGVAAALESLEHGTSEAAACTEGQYAMRKLWHEKYQQYEVSGFSDNQTAQIDSLYVWCMSNEKLCYGCDCPKGYTPKAGDLTIPMSWARIGGYCAENERTVMVGQVNNLRKRAYDAMLEARNKIFSLLHPGAVFEELYLAAMQVFIDKGFGEFLPSRCGHGMGLSSHEFPYLMKGNKTILRPNMVFTVEPGLMSKEFGAVRHSDTVLITNNGFELLTNLEHGYISIEV